MGKLFNKDKKKDETVITSAPESPETPGEAAYVEGLNKPKTEEKANEESATPQIQEVPRCMSQTEINNIIISMDMKLNYIISKMEK